MKVGDRISGYKKPAKGGKAFYRDLYKDLENPIRKGFMKKEVKKEPVKSVKKSEPVIQKNQTTEKPDRNQILKSLASEAWEGFKHKELLIESIKKTEPELTDSEVMGIAKTFAYIDMKKKEREIEDMFEKEEVKKARVDEGKSPAMKQVARAYRNSRVKFPKGSPEGEYKGKKVRPRKEHEKDKIFGEPKQNRNPMKPSRVGSKKDFIEPKLPKDD
jgi:hypothetical protein